MSRPKRAERRRDRVVVALLAVLAVVAGLGLVWFGVGGDLGLRLPGGDAGGGFVDMDGRTVVPDEDAVVEDPASDATPDIGERFIVESVGLDVPLGTARMTGNRIAPPGFTSAYVMSNLGAGIEKPESGTVFVAAHSLRGGGRAPGNYLIDVPGRGAAVHPGDTINVAGLRYRVTQTRVIPKGQIADVSDVWADVPGRLVVFTCLQNPQNTPSTENLVIIGELVEEQE